MRTYKSERYRVLPDHKRPGTWIVVDLQELAFHFRHKSESTIIWNIERAILHTFSQGWLSWPTKSQAISFVELLEATV
jgi:hypothetical protein